MERIYRAKNGVEEAVRFYVSEQAQPRTGKRNASTPRKQEQNKNQAAHMLGRILNNNFEQGDLFLSPGYSGKAFRELRKRAYDKLPKNAKKEEKRNAILAEAEKDGKLFLRRLREAGAKDLRYVLVAADMDGRTGKETQVHLHIVVSGDQFVLKNKQITLNGRTLTEIWGRAASVEYEFLRAGSYNALAAYLIRQCRTIPNRKKYSCSRNLERIEPEEYEVAVTPEDDIRVPKGAQIEERIGGPAMQYVRYVRPSSGASRHLPARGKAGDGRRGLPRRRRRRAMTEEDGE